MRGLQSSPVEPRRRGLRPRVLFVAYLFPPVGGVGVHRVTKFVKHLPQFGWDCSVLTVSNPSAPLVDKSLCRDVPPETFIRRAPTFEPGYAAKAAITQRAPGPHASGEPHKPSLGARSLAGLKGLARRVAGAVLLPDPQILWLPRALREGLDLLQSVPHDAIIATGPPFSSLMLGARLARKTNLPLILDYRDEWGISNAYWENKQHGRWANALQMRMQASAVRSADVLLATTPSSAASLADVARQAGSRPRTACIYNGFDSEDYPERPPAPRIDYGHGVARCRIACIGTLWNLNPIEPFVAGVAEFVASRPELAPHLELVFAGRRTPEQEAALDRLTDLPVAQARLPFVPHDEAISLMRDADALLLLNAEKPHTHRIINAKTFEYMAARRPMFVVAPEGDLWDVVRDLPGTELHSPGDARSIAEGLARVVEAHQQGRRPPAEDWKIARFERRRLAEELAKLLNETVGLGATKPEGAAASRPEGARGGSFAAGAVR